MFEVKGAPPAYATFSGWTFATDPAIGVITREASEQNSSSWGGKIVTSGHATVTVVLLGQTYPLPKTGTVSVAVDPREDWWSVPANPEKLMASANDACGQTVNPAAPDTCPPGIGTSKLCLKPHPLTVDKVPSGPNAGLWWVTTYSESPTYKWMIHPDVETPASDFCQHQAPTCTPWTPSPNSTCLAPVGTGYISCENIAEAITRHEASQVQNSHWVKYNASVADRDRNMYWGVESEIGWTTLNQAGFEAQVNNELFARDVNIHNDTAFPEPCDTCTDDCTQSYGPTNCKNANTGQWAHVCPVPYPVPDHSSVPSLRK